MPKKFFTFLCRFNAFETIKKVPNVLLFFFIVQKVVTHHWPTRRWGPLLPLLQHLTDKRKALSVNDRNKAHKGSQTPHQFAQEEIAILLQHKQAPMSFAWHIAHLSP